MVVNCKPADFTVQDSRLSLLPSIVQVKVTGYSCACRAKCIGKCILKLANQESLVRTV